MVKNKYLGIVWVVLSVGALGAGSWVVWHAGHNKSANNNLFGAEAGMAASQAESSASGSNIPLTPTQGTSSDNSGLSVNQSTPNNSVGQLGNSAGQNLIAGSGNGSGSGSSSPSLPDPSTFAQYDKYKNDQSALFGDIVAGTGDSLTSGKKAAVYYKGFLTNGSVFDQSRADSSGKVQPFVFELGAHQVIAGWEQALAGMKVGGVRLLIVPPAAGYGDQAQASIPANSVLVFEVQLLEVQ